MRAAVSRSVKITPRAASAGSSSFLTVAPSTMASVPTLSISPRLFATSAGSVPAWVVAKGWYSSSLKPVNLVRRHVSSLPVGHGISSKNRHALRRRSSIQVGSFLACERASTGVVVFMVIVSVVILFSAHGEMGRLVDWELGRLVVSSWRGASDPTKVPVYQFTNLPSYRLPNRPFHLQLDQPVHLDRVLHRQFLDHRLDEAGDDHGAGLVLGQAAALEVE